MIEHVDIDLALTKTAGSIPFGVSGSPYLQEDNDNLYYDDTNNRLGIVTNTPAAALEVNANTASEIAQILQTLDDDATVNLFEVQSAANTALLYITADGELVLNQDSKAVKFGAGQDLVIMHDGNNAIVDNNTGDIRIGSDGGTANYAAIESDGTIKLVGTARKTKYAWMGAQAIRGIGANPATAALNGASFFVWSFPDNLEKYIQFNLKVPDDMDLSANCHICVGWSSPTANAVCDWELTYLLTAPDEDTTAAGTMVQSDETSSANANGLVVSQVVEIAGGTISANQVCLHCFLMRDGNDANDTLGDVSEVHGIALGYVSNKLGE